MVKQSRGSASHSCLDQHNSDKKTQRNKKTKQNIQTDGIQRKKKSFQLKLESEIVQFAWLTPWLVAVFIFTPSASGGGHRSVLHQATGPMTAALQREQQTNAAAAAPVCKLQCFIALELHWNTGVLHFLHILLDYSNDIFRFVKWKHISQSIVCRRQEQNLAQRWKEICRQSPSDVDPFLFII